MHIKHLDVFQAIKQKANKRQQQNYKTVNTSDKEILDMPQGKD